jgi:hypothetical protein
MLDPFEFRISFQSSHRNAPDKYVALWMYANVRSAKLKEWRGQQSHPYRDDEWVAGGMVHVLRDKRPSIEWNLADRGTRVEVVESAINFIRSEVLPYFAQFADPALLVSELTDRQIPAFELASSVEFALCFGTREQARQILDRFSSQRQDLSGQIAQSSAAFQTKGFPPYHVTSYADQFAWVSVAYSLA